MAIAEAARGAMSILCGTLEGPMTPFQRLAVSREIGEPFDPGDVMEAMEQIERAFEALRALAGEGGGE